MPWQQHMYLEPKDELECDGILNPYYNMPTVRGSQTYEQIEAWAVIWLLSTNVDLILSVQPRPGVLLQSENSLVWVDVNASPKAFGQSRLCCTMAASNDWSFAIATYRTSNRNASVEYCIDVLDSRIHVLGNCTRGLEWNKAITDIRQDLNWFLGS
jgi:hypothetical protein